MPVNLVHRAGRGNQLTDGLPEDVRHLARTLAADGSTATGHEVIAAARDLRH